MKKKLTLLLLLFSVLSFAQVIVSGKVVDADVQQALPGANVTVKGKVDKTDRARWFCSFGRIRLYNHWAGRNNT